MFKDKFGFNFWPSFTDLMMSLVLVVLIILFVVSKMIAAGTENLEKVHQSQEQIEQQMSTQINGYTVYTIDTRNGGDVNKMMAEHPADIYVIDKLDRHTITFSDKVLFDTDKSNLKPEGQQILNVMGKPIVDNLTNISEIQIQGHADDSGDDNHNLELASARAIAVYEYLQVHIGIDPAKYLMSATSFSKYKPVGREAGDDYSANNREKLTKANGTNELKARNRRIEIVLYYKNQGQQANPS